MFEKIYKSLLLLVAVGFLFSFYLYVQNARYQRIGNDGGTVFTLDTRTGDVYVTTGFGGTRKVVPQPAPTSPPTHP